MAASASLERSADGPVRPLRWRAFLAPACRLALVAAAALFLAGSGASAQSIPTDRDGFTAYILAQLHKADPKAALRVAAPLRIAVEAPDGTHDLALDTLYSLCTRSPESCEVSVHSFVAHMATLYAGPPAPLTRAMLRTIVRPTAYVDQMRDVMAKQGGPVVVRLAGDLWLVGVFDLPTAVRMANLGTVQDLGLTADEALAAAKQNMLADMKRQIDAMLASDHSSVMVLTGDYAPSLFGYPDLWPPLAAVMRGHPLAAVPSSDVILIGDAHVRGMAATLRREAGVVMTQSRRPFSDTVFEWSDGGFKQRR